MERHQYEVNVGNVGTVYRGLNRREAERQFAAYRKISQSGRGRAGNEAVILFVDGEPAQEFLPAGALEEDDHE